MPPEQSLGTVPPTCCLAWVCSSAGPVCRSWMLPCSAHMSVCIRHCLQWQRALPSCSVYQTLCANGNVCCLHAAVEACRRHDNAMQNTSLHHTRWLVNTRSNNGPMRALSFATHKCHAGNKCLAWTHVCCETCPMAPACSRRTNGKKAQQRGYAYICVAYTQVNRQHPYGEHAEYT